jgi:hypothetical protein
MNSRARLTYIILTALFLCLALSILSAHLPALGVQAPLTKSDAKTFIIAARRSGDVEFIDPATLETVSRIHIDVNPKGVGLSGVFVNGDGSTVYVEGPTSQEGRACCSLYSIDLATMETKKAAGIWGSSSREPIVVADGVVYQSAELANGGIVKNGIGFAFHLSSNRLSLIGMTSSLAPEIDLYDLRFGGDIRKLKRPELGEGWWASGIWSGDNFYLYANKPGQPNARVWTLSSNTTQLEDGIIVDPHGEVPGCRRETFEAVTSAGGNLFLYESFGGKFDRRPGCDQKIPGGAWLLDPLTGRLLKHIAPDLYFTELIPDRTQPILYGLSSDGDNFYESVKLARIDARDVRVLQTRTLDSDFWRIITAPVQTLPTTDAHIALPQTPKQN